MDFDEFTGQVQHRLELPGTGHAVRAIRATLSMLGQRIPAEAAEDLAASLLLEIEWCPTGAVDDHGERFDWAEFLARVVVDLVAEVVPESDVQQLRDQLPESQEHAVGGGPRGGD